MPAILFPRELTATPLAPAAVFHGVRLLEDGGVRLLEDGGAHLLRARGESPRVRLLEDGGCYLLEDGGIRLLETPGPALPLYAALTATLIAAADPDPFRIDPELTTLIP